MTTNLRVRGLGQCTGTGGRVATATASLRWVSSCTTGFLHSVGLQKQAFRGSLTQTIHLRLSDAFLSF